MDRHVGRQSKINERDKSNEIYSFLLNFIYRLIRTFDAIMQLYTYLACVVCSFEIICEKKNSLKAIKERYPIYCCCKRACLHTTKVILNHI